jgi:hypothetical protein
MRTTKFIKHFFFGHAEYHASDGNGDSVILRVHYKDNYYEIENTGESHNESFRTELGEFAEDLLKRKHNTDFVRR